ncbi:hypothetical protein EDEG_02591 [Edhazardia aedis USNM 41457]|uniref:Rab-GAP TBC domain-containing protein n=1 Tax=Edhazardia aedis (strain USNM 41457) TaxID=1003232 RepID=J9D642_EDHAE|nr:hypothetical protein EDEG_02591 [Edhazardia aedis USNM 41457]|eukprot:EJW03009.1 hypothetical protein EDEG_02591 [Edhazardia aedis USNM 41457]
MEHSISPQKPCKDIEKRIKQRKTKEILFNNIKKQLTSQYCPINLSELRNFCYYGFCLDEMRPSLWKLFLNYHIKNKFKNDQLIKEKRKVYKEYLNKAIESLCSEPSIDKVLSNDVDRTIVNPLVTVVKNEESRHCYFLDSLMKYNNRKSLHRDAIKRILLTYKVTNSGIGYVQGMNWVVLPIYYVFATSECVEDVKYAEEDTYFCFFNLMTEIGENFVDKFDYDLKLGIRNKIRDVFVKLKYFDPKLYLHIKKIGLMDNLFPFKWIALLFAQDFKIHEIVYLWDRFLSDCNRFEIVIFCCVAVLIKLRKFLMANDHDICMEKLQRNDKINPEEMFVLADELRRQFYEKKK